MARQSAALVLPNALTAISSTQFSTSRFLQRATTQLPSPRPTKTRVLSTVTTVQQPTTEKSTKSPTAVAAPTNRPRSVRARLERAEQLLKQVREERTYKRSDSKDIPKVVVDTRSPVGRTTTPLPQSTNILPPATNSALLEEQAARAAKSADEGPRYDPQSAIQYFKTRSLYVRKRQLEIAVPLTTFISRVVFDIQMGREEQNRQKRAEEFLKIVSSLGPAIIKGGQAVSSRPDLLPKEYLDELQKLQDRLPPFENDIAFELIEKELGKPVNEIFASIDPTPVAAASIGQVYTAILKETGERVAVKVQRPECEEIIALDIYILRNLSGTLNRLVKLTGRDINLQSIIEEFGKLIYEEIDYISEARNAERFLELYGDLPGVDVPKIFWRYTKRKVITMEWMEGSRLTSDILSQSRSEELVRAMVQCSLRQMLENGYFHADTHLGNLLATPDGNLCYLDFGMMSEVEPSQRYGIIEAVVHMVNRDFAALANLYVRLGFLPPETDLDPIIEALNGALPDVLGASVGELNFKSVIDKLGSVMYQYPFRLPPYYTAIIRCLGVLEGVAIQVDPNFKILNEAYPYIASRLLTDPAPELQKALQCLLFDEGRPRWNRLESLLDSASNAGDYDASLAIEQLLSYLLSPQGKLARYNLADELTEELDTLGVDITKYYASIAAQTGTAAGLRLPAVFRSLPAPTRTRSMDNFDKFVQILSKSKGFDPTKMTPIVRRFLREPESQRIGLEITVSLAERLTSRAIRFAFGLPQEAPKPRRDI